MTATAVDTLPGGLIDFLRYATPEDLPGLNLLVGGQARAAADALAAHRSSPVGAAWHYLAEHSAMLALPEGGALPLLDPVDPRPFPPLRPELPPRSHVGYRVCWALTQLCGALREGRRMLPPLSPFETAASVPLVLVGGDSLDKARSTLVPGWPALGPYVDLLAAELAGRAGQDACSALVAARSGFVAQGNRRGAAGVSVVLGDHAAAPLASPVTWGLALATTTGATNEVSKAIEALEQSPARDAAAAAAAYDEAEQLYAAADDVRGTAVVAWRRAYLAYITGRPDLAAERAAAAAAELTTAGDPGSALLATAHAALAGIGDGRMPVEEEVAAPVVAWGTGRGSLSQAIGIGIMFGRAGRRWTRERRPERAMAAFAVAEAIWAGLHRPVSRSQILVDQADLLSSIGAGRAALLCLSRAVEVDDPPVPGAANAIDPRLHRAVTVAAKLHGLASDAEDIAAMDRAEHRLRQLVDPLRAPRPDATPEQLVMTLGLIGVADETDRRVNSLLTRARAARDLGDQAASERYFAEAELAVRGMEPADAELHHIYVLAFRMRFWQAAARLRPWLAKRLAIIAAARPGAGAIGAMLADQRERAIRHQGMTFAVRVGDARIAREQFTALQASADPWWAEQGTAWEAEDTLGELLELEGDLDGAAAAFARAVDAAEAGRAELRRDDLRQAFGSDNRVQRIYRNAARVELRRAERGGMYAARYRMAAVRLLELARSRALADLMSAPATGLDAAAVTAWRAADAERTLCQDRVAAALAADPPDPARVAKRSAELAAAEQAFDAAEARLRDIDPRFWSLAASAAGAPDPRSLLAALPDGHAVLMYSFGKPNAVLCGLTSAGVLASAWSQQERRIERLAGALVDACADGGPWEQPAAELAAVLLEPLAAALDGAHTVHVVASGETQRVPFAVLPWRGEPLGRRFVVTSLPNLAAFELLGALTSAQGPALCVGNPSAMSYRRTPDEPPRPQRDLPAAAVEAAAVAGVLGGTPLLGPAATAAAVRAALPGAPVVHLATHGVLDTESALASAVLLADGEQLGVAELVGIRLHAELVVLCACQSGTGAPTGGDEPLGLGRVLLAAGARSAVVTLWPVNDASAALVMTRFQTLRAGGMPAARALGEATAWLAGLTAEAARAEFEQLRAHAPAEVAARPVDTRSVRTISGSPPVTAPYAHPQHWAPYVLIGR